MIISLIYLTTLSWGLALWLTLARHWILNWTPDLYHQDSSNPFPDPKRLQEYPLYKPLLGWCCLMPGFLWGLFFLIKLVQRYGFWLWR